MSGHASSRSNHHLLRRQSIFLAHNRKRPGGEIAAPFAIASVLATAQTIIGSALAPQRRGEEPMFMGHSKIQMTFAIYGHLLPGSGDEVRRDGWTPIFKGTGRTGNRTDASRSCGARQSAERRACHRS